MGIRVRLDLLLAERGMRLMQLAREVGVSTTNLSIFKTNKGRAIRFPTLEALCRVLDCQPGDLLEYVPEQGDGKSENSGRGRRADGRDRGQPGCY